MPRRKPGKVIRVIRMRLNSSTSRQRPRFGVNGANSDRGLRRIRHHPAHLADHGIEALHMLGSAHAPHRKLALQAFPRDFRRMIVVFRRINRNPAGCAPLRSRKPSARMLTTESGASYRKNPPRQRRGVSSASATAATSFARSASTRDSDGDATHFMPDNAGSSAHSPVNATGLTQSHALPPA